MKIMTCNIRFSSMGYDTGDRFWPNRRDNCFRTIRKRNPDLICLQECHNDQLRDFKAEFGKEYSWFHGNSYASDYFPENAIFYRKEYENLGTGAWQLSETPHIAGSKSWGTECNRLVNWILLKTPEGTFRLINTHFDHASRSARDNAARMVCEDAAAWDASLPQILTGDLNCPPQDDAIRCLERAGWCDTMPEKDRYAVTCHEFMGPAWPDNGKSRIDYIFVRGGIRSRETEIVRDSENGVFPSDHYFIASELEIPAAK